MAERGKSAVKAPPRSGAGRKRPGVKRPAITNGAAAAKPQVIAKAKTPARATPKPRKKPKDAAQRRHPLIRLAYWSAVAGVWVAVFVGTLVAYCVVTLPDPTRAGLADRPPNVTLLAADGTVLAERGMRRNHVRLDALPDALVQAVVNTEDRRFYYHPGLDPIGLARAAVTNYRAGRIVEGGSTITQQLAKNLFLSNARTVDRKIQETIIALWLEWRMTKAEILELYLNRVYFGAGAYGVEAAAQRYFGKSARILTLAESAMLAGLLKAPSRLAPTRSPKAAQARAAVVLDALAHSHIITAEAARDAKAKPARVRPPRQDDGAGYAVDWLLDQLDGFVGDATEDLIVETTIDARVQKAAAKLVAQTLDKRGPALNASQAAAVLLDHDGAVRALIGGRDYRDSGFNRAVHARRQPGSAFKPIVYLAALEKGLAPDSLVEDRPVRIGTWQPKNAGRSYHGEITFAESLAWSSNSVAVQAWSHVGYARIAQVARRLGIQAVLHRKPSLALGTAEVTLLELTQAYVPFANGGYGALPHGVARVRTVAGAVLYQRAGSGLGRIIRPHIASQMDDMLRGVVAYGTGRAAARPGVIAGGKTGTTQEARDAWFIGYAGGRVLGVWVGNDDNAPMTGVTGGGLPAEIWRGLMGLPGMAMPPVPTQAGPARASLMEPGPVEPSIGTLLATEG